MFHSQFWGQGLKQVIKTLCSDHFHLPAFFIIKKREDTQWHNSNDRIVSNVMSNDKAMKTRTTWDKLLRKLKTTINKKYEIYWETGPPSRPGAPVG